MAKDEEVLGKAYDARLMRRLIRYLKPYWWKVALAILITIAVSALGPLQPYLIMHAIDDQIATGNMKGLTMILALIVGTVVFQALVQYGQTVVTQWIGQQTVYDLRKELFGHLQ